MEYSARVVGSRYAMLDWQRELNSIIRQTERNLQGRTDPFTVPPRRGGLGMSAGLSGGYGTRPAAAAAPRDAPREGAPATQGGSPGGLGSSQSPPPSGMTEEKLHELLQQISQTSSVQDVEDVRTQQGAFKEAFSRVLDGIKFELDMRQNLTAKQLEALRDELNTALATTERRAVDASKELDLVMQSRLAAEKEMRMSTEVSVEGLRQNVAAAQQDVNRSLGELQDLLIAQREATHSLEKELMAYKLDTEARLTEDAKRMATLDRQVQTLGGTVEPHVSNESVALRLQEVEMALLNERELRKMVELEVSAIKSHRDDLTAEIDERLATVRSQLPAHGAPHDASVRALDEKVKECAKLIVRMGSELMEETRRRQRLEEDMSELRTRLATMESVQSSAMAAAYQTGPSRSPPPQTRTTGLRGPGTYSPVPMGAAGGYSAAGSPPPGVGARAPARSPSGNDAAIEALLRGSASDSAYARGGGGGAPTAAGLAARHLSGQQSRGGGGGGAADFGGGGFAGPTWADETAAAVSSRVRHGSDADPHSGPPLTDPSTGRPRAEPGGSGGTDAQRGDDPRSSSLGGEGSGAGGSLSATTVDERVRSILSKSNSSLQTIGTKGMTREELDARVQEILGRHGGGGGGGGAAAHDADS